MNQPLCPNCGQSVATPGQHEAFWRDEPQKGFFTCKPSSAAAIEATEAPTPIFARALAGELAAASAERDRLRAALAEVRRLLKTHAPRCHVEAIAAIDAADINPVAAPYGGPPKSVVENRETMAKAAADRMVKLAASPLVALESLIEAMKGAPHHIGERVACEAAYKIGGKCSCWKSRALAEVERIMEEGR